jgi:hypothetical protein
LLANATTFEKVEYIPALYEDMILCLAKPSKCSKSYGQSQASNSSVQLSGAPNSTLKTGYTGAILVLFIGVIIVAY